LSEIRLSIAFSYVRTMQNSPPLKATLKLPQITALYIGAVLGSGILIIPGVAAEVSGPASMLAWGLMIILVLPMALTIGLLSAKYPHVGGVSYFAARAFNSHIGSLIGWYFLMAVVVAAPVLALTGAGYLCTALGLDDTYRLIIAIAILFLGLLTNYFGMKITGQIQMAVVLTTLAVLIVTIAGSFSRVSPNNFKPFMPNGWVSVGLTSTILFWCFIGWEAVSNMSEEFQNPRQDAIRGTLIAAVIISIIYFLTAYVVVGTHSYGQSISDASLVYIIKGIFGEFGAVIAGFAALFICMAPAIAYIGAVSRLAYSLSDSGYAPKPLSYLSRKYETPLGGLCFLAFCFAVLLVVFSTRIISMATLIQIPSATFILTYLGASAAGIKLLKGSTFGVIISFISLILSAVIFLFVKWTVLYPAMITLIWYAYMSISNRTLGIKALFKQEG
jgi:amino acid efflux transporter